MSLSLAACATPSTPAVEYRYVLDLPDEALVAPCDTTEQPVEVNGDMLSELARTRTQRDNCAGQVAGTAQWRRDAIKRNEQRNNP